jgi:type II secretory pathway component GspD/PulD (secretin)
MVALRARVRVLAAAMAVGGLVVVGSLIGLAAPETPGQTREPTVEKLRQALNQKVTIELANLSLEDAVAKLRDVTKLPFVADKSAYAMQWMPQDGGPAGKQGGISLRIENAKFGPAFKAMLGDYGLGYAILGDTILLTQQQEAARRQMEQPVTLSLDQVALNAALKRLSRDTGTNIVIDSRATKEAGSTVSLTVTDVALEDGVRLLANMAGLKTVRVGSVLYVTTKANATDFQNEVQSAGRSVPGGNPYSYPSAAALMRARGFGGGFGGGGRGGRMGPPAQ